MEPRPFHRSSQSNEKFKLPSLSSRLTQALQNMRAPSAQGAPACFASRVQLRRWNPRRGNSSPEVPVWPLDFRDRLSAAPPSPCLHARASVGPLVAAKCRRLSSGQSAASSRWAGPPPPLPPRTPAVSYRFWYCTDRLIRNWTLAQLGAWIWITGHPANVTFAQWLPCEAAEVIFLSSFNAFSCSFFLVFARYIQRIHFDSTNWSTLDDRCLQTFLSEDILKLFKIFETVTGSNSNFISNQATRRLSSKR